MCYSPIKIKNNSKSSTHHTNFIRYVPCGKCHDCVSKYTNEWYLRALYHFKEYNKLGGCCSFITLTYNNQCLPMYEDDYYVVDDHKVVKKHLCCPVFSKTDIQYFIKYARRYAKTNFHYTTKQCNKITQIICCEYGSKNTQRSHYHGLLFFPTRLEKHELCSLLDYAWSYTTFENNNRKKPIHHKLGFYSFGKNGAFVTSPSALKYCMKYSAKQMAGLNDVHNLVEYVEAHPDNYEKIKDKLPFHLQSRGFGLYGLKLLDSSDFIKGFVYDDLKDKRGNLISLPIPQYLKRKYFTTKPLVQNNARCGMFAYGYNYFRLLPQMLQYTINTQIEKLQQDFVSCESFCQAYKNETTADLTKLYNFYNDHIKLNVEDFVIYTMIKDYSSDNYPLFEDETSFSLLLSIKRGEAIAHNINVNTHDLTYLFQPVREELEYYNKLDTPCVNPFYVDPDYYDCLYSIGRTAFNLPDTHKERELWKSLNTFYLPDSLCYSQHPRIKYVPDGIPVRKSRPAPWYQVNKSDLNHCKNSVRFQDYPRFKHFERFRSIYEQIRNTKTKHVSIKRNIDYMKSKELKDKENSFIYNVIDLIDAT